MSEIVVVSRDGDIAIVKLNRPKAFNALDLELMESFAKALVTLAADDTARGVVICGEGKAFCAGGDLKWVLGYPGGPPVALHELAARLDMAVTEIRRMKKPVIAAINGVAAGAGFSIALVCDFRVMEKSATMKQAYTSAGLCIDGGGTYALPRLVGLARAMEIVAFDKSISSEQALKWGLVNKVVEDDKAIEEAVNMAREIAKGSLNAFGMVKQLLTDSFDTSFETQIERERTGIADSSAHPDGREGLSAFTEKRKPVFGKRKTS